MIAAVRALTSRSSNLNQDRYRRRHSFPETVRRDTAKVILPSILCDAVKALACLQLCKHWHELVQAGSSVFSYSSTYAMDMALCTTTLRSTTGLPPRCLLSTAGHLQLLDVSGLGLPPLAALVGKLAEVVI